MADLLTNDKAPEGWSWKKFFLGFVDGRNTAKAIVLSFHTCLIIALVGLSVFGGLYLKNKLAKKPEEQRVIKVESQGGPVDASQKTKKCEVNLIKFGGTNQ